MRWTADSTLDGAAGCAKVEVGSLDGRRTTMKRQRVLDLRPTQFAIGMTEVGHKAKRLHRLSKKKLAKYVRQNPVTVVRAPDRDLYVIDRHHTLMAYWLAWSSTFRLSARRSNSSWGRNC